MQQNSVGDVNESAYLKQIGDQDVARCNLRLDVDSFLDLILQMIRTMQPNPNESKL
jgi:hypothetical protein